MGLFRDSVFSPIPEEHLGQASLPAIKVQECYEHMADPPFEMEPRSVEQEIDLINMDGWKRAPAKTTHRVFINLPYGQQENIIVPKSLKECNKNNQNQLASFSNLGFSNMGQHAASSGVSQRFEAGDIIPEEYLKDD